MWLRLANTVHYEWKREVPMEQGRHQVLAVCLRDHVLQVLECCYDLSSGIEGRCYEELDGHGNACGGNRSLPGIDVCSLSWKYTRRTTTNVLQTLHYLAHRPPALFRYLHAQCFQHNRISFWYLIWKKGCNCLTLVHTGTSSVYKLLIWRLLQNTAEKRDCLNV